MPRFLISSEGEEDDVNSYGRLDSGMFTLDCDVENRPLDLAEGLAGEGVDEITSPREYAKKLVARLPPKVSSAIF